MDSPPAQDTPIHPHHKDKELQSEAVDPFLKEALQNPRHRLTILRMELDIQKFVQDNEQQQFEFPHYPTSYLRLAAHRVAQHYGLQSMVVVDNDVDSQGTRIVARKTAGSKYPALCLSEVPAEQPENDKPEQVKIAIRPRLQKATSGDANSIGNKRSPVRTVEERKEEYDRARARIFSNSSSPDLEDESSHGAIEGSGFCFGRDENEGYRNVITELDKTPIVRDGNTSSRVAAIFRDREKDRSDPDYDRSYERYVRGLSQNQNFSLGPFNAQIFQPPFLQYETGFLQPSPLPRTQTSFTYRPSASPMMNPFCAVGVNQTMGDSLYMQCPSLAMMYTQSYEQFRHAVFQAPFYHQPLSFDYSQNH